MCLTNPSAALKKCVAIVLALCLLSTSAQAGVGTGKVLDVTLRSQDGMLLVKVTTHNAPPGCVGWYHTFVKPYDGSPTSKAFLAMLLSAQTSGKSVRVSGTGGCFAGTAAEEIAELNVGDWGQ